MLFKCLFLVFVELLAFMSIAKTKELALPNTEKRQAMVYNLSREILRLDGEGLIPRANRAESWETTIQRLSKEAAEAKNLYDLGRVFRRVDATYPNLHAKVFLIPELDERKTEGSVVFPITFFPVSAGTKFTGSKFKISTRKEAKSDFQMGDELISINSRPLQEWTDENFLFCKFPYREQCEIEFYDNFRKELLSWNRHQSLELKVRRGKKELNIALNLKIKPFSQDVESTNLPCDVSSSRYKGFKLAYEGENLCAFESVRNSNIVTLRIKSFVYQDMPFAVLDGEVQLFWNNYWSKKSPKVKTLIIDVIDNPGGQSPIPYYGLFYSQAYQEQYVQFKKITEFERKDILESLFWGDRGKEIWFENIKKDGTFSNAKNGEFFGQIPQFCANRKKDCREDLFKPRANGFKGQVKILMNQWCVSSYVGFVSNIKDLLKERVKTYGIPDSGDSAYSRLTIFVSPQAETAVAPLKKGQKPDQPEPWIRQVVSVTRSTDKDGKILSGTPQVIDVWVPRIWNQSDDEWAASVFDKAMGK